jgi:DNA replication protein DnaC
MTALGHAACLQGYSVLFTGAVEIINTLALAQTTGSMKSAMARYVKPQLLCIDELGYLKWTPEMRQRFKLDTV